MIGSAEVEGAEVANVERVVAGMKAGFRACYNRGLVADPTSHGRIKIILTVGSQGEVIAARAEPVGALPDEITGCLVRRGQMANFVAPEPAGSQATISFPLTLRLDDVGPDFR